MKKKSAECDDRGNGECDSSSSLEQDDDSSAVIRSWLCCRRVCFLWFVLDVMEKWKRSAASWQQAASWMCSAMLVGLDFRFCGYTCLPACLPARCAASLA